MLARIEALACAPSIGAVLTTAVSDRYDAGGGLDPHTVQAALDLAAPGGGPVVVRSSSVVEDQASWSHAGQFETVLDVRGVGPTLDKRWRSSCGRGRRLRPTTSPSAC